MSTGGPLGRESMGFREQMERYHGEIERLVYAAEIECLNAPGQMRQCPECPFNIRISEPICPIKQLRHIIGDQHDCSKEGRE